MHTKFFLWCARIDLAMDNETKKLKILIVDNHVEVVTQIKARLSMEKDFEVCKVACLDSLTEAILECQPDVPQAHQMQGLYHRP